MSFRRRRERQYRAQPCGSFGLTVLGMKHIIAPNFGAPPQQDSGTRTGNEVEIFGAGKIQGARYGMIEPPLRFFQRPPDEFFLRTWSGPTLRAMQALICHHFDQGGLS
jgi:hypothetical protein